MFFDLDEQEIRKLFTYFDKQSYFDNHKYDIIYEFKKYTEENGISMYVHEKLRTLLNDMNKPIKKVKAYKSIKTNNIR